MSSDHRSRKLEINWVRGNKCWCREDEIAVEEPLQIYVQGNPAFVTMRTPGDERALAAGLCLTEGIIDRLDDVLSIELCDNSPHNEVYIKLTEDCLSRVGHILDRGLVEGRSSCSQCGKQLIEDTKVDLPRIETDLRISPEFLHRCGELMAEQQQLFSITGCTHAAALFNKQAELISFGEDIGRHNALDKAIGKGILDGNLNSSVAVFVTSRASFEMVQKAVRAKQALLIATSGPTSMSVDLAKNTGLTLVAFCRSGRLNVYAGEDRIDFTNYRKVDSPPRSN